MEFLYCHCCGVGGKQNYPVCIDCRAVFSVGATKLELVVSFLLGAVIGWTTADAGGISYAAGSFIGGLVVLSVFVLATTSRAKYAGVYSQTVGPDDAGRTEKNVGNVLLGLANYRHAYYNKSIRK